jgi:hypothetical protein
VDYCRIRILYLDKIEISRWTCAEGRQKGKQSIKQMNRCAYKKARLQWDSFSNDSNRAWWWPNVAETCCTSVETDVLKVVLV